jgi:hypothetical protein
MSYEGTEEYLCEKGHYTAYDCNSGTPAECSICKAKIKYHHSVDETNGFDEEDPRTTSAPTLGIGFEDDWHTDHYGNLYALKVLLFSPNSSEWREI